MSGQCVSWMVVSSDTTRIDTEALVGDVLFLRRIREALDSQLGAAHSLNQELCAHQCGGVLQRLCALGAQLSEQIGSCADRLAYVASIHAAAEADAASYQKTVRRLGGSMGELSWAGGLTASRKIAGAGKSLCPFPLRTAWHLSWDSNYQRPRSVFCSPAIRCVFGFANTNGCC